MQIFILKVLNVLKTLNEQNFIVEGKKLNLQKKLFIN